MRIIAFITEPKVIDTILRHLQSKAAAGRGPPPRAETEAASSRRLYNPAWRLAPTPINPSLTTLCS